MKRILYVCIVVFLVASPAAAKRQHSEKWYQQSWCEENGGRAEVVMPDGTRCDCVTATHAVEFDFAGKWSEAIGQSLNYAMQTNLKPGIVMIVERPEERRHWIRLNSIILHFKLPIDTWLVMP